MTNVRKFFLASHLTLSESERAWIGTVAVESAYLEKIVEKIIWSLAGLSSGHGQLFTDAMRLGAKLDLLEVLGKAHTTDAHALDGFLRILSEVRTEAVTHRNTIIHGEWRHEGLGVPLNQLLKGVWAERIVKATQTRRGKAPIVFDAVNIERTAHEIARLTIELVDFAEVHWPDLR